MSASAASLPVPAITEEMRPFFEAAREGRLVVQRCRGCGAHRFPAREICSRCLDRGAQWTEVSGRGTIFSYCVMHQIYHPALAERVPYAVVIVELEEGARLTSNVIDCPVSEIRIGMPVEVTFEAVSPEVTLPKFKRA